MQEAEKEQDTMVKVGGCMKVLLWLFCIVKKTSRCFIKTSLTAVTRWKFCSSHSWEEN